MGLLLNRAFIRIVADENGVMEIDYADTVLGPNLSLSKLIIHSSEVDQFVQDLLEAAQKHDTGEE